MDPSNGPSRALPPLGEVLDFLRLVWAVDHALQRTSKRMERTLGVTGPQRLVIRLVGRFPGVSAGQLAEVMSVHPSTMTGILRRLEARGLVQRRVDARDRRRLFLGLTAAGRELNVTESGTVEAAVDRVIHSLPEKRIAAAREVLATLARALAL